MPVIPPQKYKDIESSLKTGDLFLFYGQSDAGILIEDLESIAGMPPYSHVGMVINDQGNLYFWDAPGGGNTFPDPYGSDPNNRIYGQTPQEGCCRVAALGDLLTYYATVVEQPFELRQLSAPVSAEAFAALRIFIDRVDGFGFPKGMIHRFRFEIGERCVQGHSRRNHSLNSHRIQLLKLLQVPRLGGRFQAGKRRQRHQFVIRALHVNARELIRR